jgi:hypothetical protein
VLDEFDIRAEMPAFMFKGKTACTGTGGASHHYAAIAEMASFEFS